MAKIEMDISEYEVMKENKKLLEVSLQRERSLQEEVKKLNDEKIKALEDAKMKVVKISKSVRHEYIMIMKKPEEVRDNIIFLARRFQNREFNLINPVLEEFTNYFFKKGYSESANLDEEITTHGLDEIKAEIKADYKKSMDAEIKDKLERADKAFIEKSEVVKKNRELIKMNSNLVKNNSQLMDLVSESDNNLKSILGKLEEIQQVLKNGYSLFNRSNLLDKIISIIK